jgi:hypothetical protein
MRDMSIEVLEVASAGMPWNASQTGVRLAKKRASGTGAF